MATAVDCGDSRLRDHLSGQICDLCGDGCHPECEICVALSCGRCDTLMYHQACVEKFLKKFGFASNRKTGFPCPRGKGKGTKSSDECKGKIDKSHPIIPKNEEKKKKALPPPMAEVIAKQPKPKEAAKPPAMPRKQQPPKPYQLTAVINKARHPTPPVANAWHRADGINNAVKAAPEAAAPAAEDAPAAGPKPANVPVGLVLEEAIGKAQKKNLARRKKKHTGGDNISEAGTAATDHSFETNSLDDWAAAEQQGHGRAAAGAGGSSGTSQLLCAKNFVTDIKRYQQLLGMYMADDDDDEQEDSDRESFETETLVLSPAHSASSGGGHNNAVQTGASSSAAAAAAAPAATHSPAAPPLTPAGKDTPAVKDTSAEDAALQEALALSVREYEVQQEMQRQRELLAGALSGHHGYGTQTAAGLAHAAPPAFNFPNAPQVSVPMAAPLAPSPVVLPTFSLPVAQPIVPVAVPAAADSTLLHDNGGGYHVGGVGAGLPYQQQQSFKAPVASMAPAAYGGYAYGVPASTGVFGGGYGAPSGAAGYGVAPAMAAGHDVSAGADDDDELGSLLALCGVAG